MQRELKYGRWIYDDDTKELTIEVFHPSVKEGKHQKIIIPKVYIFTTARALTSIFQRMPVRRRKPKEEMG